MLTSQLLPGISSTDKFDGRYELITRLGSGQFGEVWKARDATTGRIVALKLLNPARTTPDAAWREATLLTSLSSPFLVAVHGAAMGTNSIPYIDMALLDGSTKSKADPLGVDEATAVRWILRVTRGLQLCHERRLLHRDVKPDNILLTQTGDALLGDFGVTAVMAADGSATEHGDPEIRAPESFGGRCTVQSDVYALGITLYYLVAGRYPHRLDDHGRNLADLRDAVQTGVPDIRDTSPHITVGLARVIRNATVLDPALRYPTAADLDAALAGLRPAKRIISEVPPCTGAIRCWHAGPGHRETVRPVHVCTTPSGSRKIRIETRHVGGNKIGAHCTQTTPAALSGRLRAVFRYLL